MDRETKDALAEIRDAVRDVSHSITGPDGLYVRLDRLEQRTPLCQRHTDEIEELKRMMSKGFIRAHSDRIRVALLWAVAAALGMAALSIGAQAAAKLIGLK